MVSSVIVGSLVGVEVATRPYRRSAMTTAVDKWPASARLFGGRYGGPLTHRSYTTPWGTTQPIVRRGHPDRAFAPGQQVFDPFPLVVTQSETPHRLAPNK